MDWDHLYSSFRSFANRAAVKINQTADIATLQVRVSMAEKKLEEAYGALGHVSYEHFTGDTDLSERVAKAVSGVNDATIALRALQAELAQAKKRAEETKSADTNENHEPTEQDVTDTQPTAPLQEADGEIGKEGGNPDPSAALLTHRVAVSSYSDSEETVEITVEETL